MKALEAKKEVMMDFGLCDRVRVISGPHKGIWGVYIAGDMKRDPRRYGISDDITRKIHWCLKDELEKDRIEQAQLRTLSAGGDGDEIHDTIPCEK
jgi:hypothetical protein